MLATNTLEQWFESRQSDMLFFLFYEKVDFFYTDPYRA